MNGSTSDGAQGRKSYQGPKRKGRHKDISPQTGAKYLESAAETVPLKGEETEQHELHDTDQARQQEREEAEVEYTPEGERVCGYLVHPAAAIFPRMTDEELEALADDIKKHGQRQPIVQHPDDSLIDGVNRGRVCDKFGLKPWIIKWDGKPGEEIPYVISQNLARRHLDQSQKAMIAERLAALRQGQRQTGKSAGLPTQAAAAKMMKVGERIVRTARKIRKETSANVTRLVEAGRLTVNAVERVWTRLSPADRQRIEGMTDDEAEAEVKRLNNESSAKRKRMTAEATDGQASKARAATAPQSTTADANEADDDDHHSIGVEAVARALRRTGVEATPKRQAFADAIARLSPEDAAWACQMASYVEQEVRNIEKADRRGDDDVSAPPVATAHPADTPPS
jgi:ParB-like chromosome segregation protein Spo0J